MQLPKILSALAQPVSSQSSTINPAEAIISHKHQAVHLAAQM